ncbi:MAG: amidohydrolase [Planctomycetes bacterium]|nr:amidohydrolase [Planctomycetota bacterium]
MTTILLTALLAVATPATPDERADVLLFAPRIHTVDPQQPAAEFVAWRDGRIVAVGPREQGEAWRARAESVLEAPLGSCIVPGFIDSHAHLFAIGHALRELDLNGTRDYAEVIARVAERAAREPAGRFLRGRGWDQNDWPETRFPHHAELSRATPDHPVVLQRVDGHALLCNARALQLAGIDERTVAPAGGEIVRDDHGVPTGVLIDRACDLVTAVLPPPAADEEREALALAQQACAEHGITSLHDAGIGRERLALLQAAADAGSLTVRLHEMLDGDDAALLEEWFARGPWRHPGGFLAVRAVKVYADGALGSRGAWLLEEYADRPGHRGLSLIGSEELVALGTRALRAGFQLCTHAIGDAANRQVLDAYERVLRGGSDATGGVARDVRWRIEHAQLLAPADVPRFAALGVVASMQSCHATSDAPWVPARIGAARAESEAYVWRTLLASGARLCNGTDAPVEPLSPLRNLAAAQTRQDPDGSTEGDRASSAFFAAQCLTGREALASATASGAHAAFREDELGVLRVGACADLVLLSADPTALTATSWRSVKVLRTFVAGRTVHALD